MTIDNPFAIFLTFEAKHLKGKKALLRFHHRFIQALWKFYAGVLEEQMANLPPLPLTDEAFEEALDAQLRELDAGGQERVALFF